ncbi:RsmF rRNA methyltransferase first C-terminal domain-containing protein [Anaerobutyricum soehngenii]|uniref:RsmF rRNA methyltransferase first C-terminal domain-containing protein n=1 Tax=Anaerobutyricum soehngenii TaxID=105843 RepID=UPI001C112782|nr:RsmF rRNA methyltransferase first C-terminal domain-containing protein [Anaerobutyricum soehngenii]MBU5416179.1 RsmF rRNA methyltransferase first C-terminal domain-containing protein [Anaerobutyricum soehngenii]
MADLPQSFLDSMKEILGEDYEAFLAGFDGQRQYGLRVNTLKMNLEEFERIAPFHLKKVPWISNGYFYEAEDAPAKHPFYSAGLYYLQEPSAMTPASRLKVQPGERVLDLCAAPGGKATELGAALQGEGLLVANDINTARARALLRNLELFGISNSFVTNEPPHVLAERFPEFFHKIMVDAPCSGEGMFRKNPAVVDSWQEKGPEYFSKLQREIIVQAADMLLPGGMMFYSTCTFSPLENEKTITHLLKERPDMEVIPMEDYEGFAEGLTSYRGEVFDKSCKLCRRIWPHKMSGEGHFMALLHKKSGTQQQVQQTVSQSSIWWEKCKGLNKEQKAAAEDFFSHVNIAYDEKRIDVRGDNLYYLPAPKYDGRGLHFLRNGLFMGEFKKKRFEPSQPFALALHAQDFDQVLDFPADDERLSRYLRGETLDVSDLIAGEKKRKGWQLVMVAGHPLGFGKLVNNNLKNKYPAGWRKNN